MVKVDARAERKPAPTGREFVQGLQRGFSVIKAFSAGAPVLTIADVAGRAHLTRAVARRYLLTLKELGYVTQKGKGFSLTPRVLDLGFTYLSTMSVATVARPYMEEVVESLRESCSISVLDGRDVVYIARVTAKRIMSTNLAVGSRLPAHCTSMGKLFLAAMSQESLGAYFAAGPLRAMTARSICDEARLRKVLVEVRERGWAYNDGESEEGLRSLAVPLFDHDLQVQAAMNVAGHSSRISMKDLRGRHLDVLLKASASISRALGVDPSQPHRRNFGHDTHWSRAESLSTRSDF